VPQWFKAISGVVGAEKQGLRKSFWSGNPNFLLGILSAPETVSVKKMRLFH
jgi:dihydroorotase